MAYFPFFADIEDRSVLIVGGGTVALRKAEKLLPYGPRISVLSPEHLPELEALPVELIKGTFQESVLEGCDFVISATDDGEINSLVSKLCREKHIPVNVVDDIEQCSFIFPSLIKKGKLSIGISTQGASPSTAVWLKEKINSLLPEALPEILDFLDESRPLVKESFVNGHERAEVFKSLFELCMLKGRAATVPEAEEIIERYKK